MSWAQFHQIPIHARQAALRAVLTTKIYLARCTATRLGIDVGDVFRSWRVSPP